MTTRVLRPIAPAAPPTSWMHPEDAARKRSDGSQFPTGLIYRFYDANQELLYIGQTTSGHTYPIRWTAHRRSAPWWELVAYYAVDRVASDLVTLTALEKSAIQTERPRFNKHHARSRSSFMVFTREGPAAVIEQFRAYLLPDDFAELVRVFKALPDND